MLMLVNYAAEWRESMCYTQSVNKAALAALARWKFPVWCENRIELAITNHGKRRCPNRTFVAKNELDVKAKIISCRWKNRQLSASETVIVMTAGLLILRRCCMVPVFVRYGAALLCTPINWLVQLYESRMLFKPTPRYYEMTDRGCNDELGRALDISCRKPVVLPTASSSCGNDKSLPVSWYRLSSSGCWKAGAYLSFWRMDAGTLLEHDKQIGDDDDESGCSVVTIVLTILLLNYGYRSPHR